MLNQLKKNKNYLSYNAHAEGCGLEDNGITDRYDSMAYGYEQGLDAAFEAVDNVA